MPAMITTKDNPHDPRDDFPAWFAWDIAHGYNTCAYLARVSAAVEDFPEGIAENQTEEAIDEIIRLHNGEIYEKLAAD